MAKKTSFYLFKALKEFTDSQHVLDAEKNKDVCKFIDDFIDDFPDTARKQIKASIEMGLIEGLLNYEPWQKEVEKLESKDLQSVLLGNENGFTRSKLLVTFEYESSVGEKKESKLSIPAPYNPMMNRIEARKAASEKHRNPQIISIETIFPKERSKQATLER